MTRDDIEDVYELSPLQQGILVHEVRDPGSSLYAVELKVELDELDPIALRAAWQAVVERTPALRTSIHWEAIDKPLQVVHRAVELPLFFGRSARDERKRAFSLDRAPLFSVDVVSSDGRHVLTWTYHHILLDGWSAGLLLQDLLSAYQAARGDVTGTTRMRRPFSDYIGWLQAQDEQRSFDFWRLTLGPVSGPTLLPTFKLSNLAESGCRRTIPVRMPSDVMARLRSALAEIRVTTGTIVHAAWGLLLHRYSGDRTVVFGATVSGRSAQLEGVDEMIGLFVNALPVVLCIEPERTLHQWLISVQDALISMREYEHTPLVDVRRASGTLAGQSLFHSLLAYERHAPTSSNAAGARILPGAFAESGTDLPLSLCLAESHDGLIGPITFDTNLLDAAFVEMIPAHLDVLLRSVPRFLDRPIRDLPMLTNEELKRMVQSNGPPPHADYPTSIHHLFLATARDQPERIAVVHGSRQVTYRDLAAAAMRFARRLRDGGVDPESRVGLCCQRTPEMIAAMYGILAAGGAYVPLDPAYPAKRLEYIATDAKLSHWVGDSSSELNPPSRSVVKFDLEPIVRGDVPTTSDIQAQGPSNWRTLAYVLYTSGSTGQPKGVAIEHRSAVARLRWARETYTDEELNGVLASTSINFDCSIFEIFAPLSWGGLVILAASSAEVPDVAHPHEIRLASLVPSNLLAQLKNGLLPPSLRGVNLGGEASPSELRELLAAHHSNLEIFHVYGPTEDTTYTTCARLHVTHGEIMPIGRPLPGSAVFVLDAVGRPVPPGCVGEVHVGGWGLARGYLDRPELTADRFVPDYVSGKPGARLYRTGDMARRRLDGEIELVGRSDQQVKIRGYRIELGEIESVLSQHPAIREAAVVLRTSENGDRYLIGFVTPRASAIVDLSGLGRWLSERLPSPMVPARFAVLQVLPRTPNGKVDRRALPEAPETAKASGDEGDGLPRDRLELELTRVWEEILGRTAVRRDEAFADLGGHSLHAVSVIARVQRSMGIRLPFAAMVGGVTIAALADATRGLKTMPLTPVVTLASRGAGSPMFLIHPALGGVLCYGELVRYLEGRAPLFALQAPGLDDDAEVLTSVEAMSRSYAQEVARMAPEGLVTVGGWSFGAAVAHDLACLLERQGRPSKLILIDPPKPDGTCEPPPDRAILAAFAEQLRLPAHVRAAQCRTLAELLQHARRSAAVPTEVDDGMAQRMFNVFSTNVNALANHQPKGFGGPTAMITASERWQDSASEVALAWRPFIERFDVHEVPGNHVSMMQRPHVERVAELLQMVASSS